MSRSLILLLSALTASATLGCNKDAPEEYDDPPYAIDAALSRFTSCAELRAYTVDAYTEMLVQSRYGGYGRAVPEAGDDFAADDGAAAPDSSSPSDYSDTNVQEAGVDEPDIVKTDGNHVYIATQQGELTIVKSWPVEDSEVVGRLPLEGWPSGMFLHEDTLVVYSSVYMTDGGAGRPSEGYATRISVIDISDRTSPTTLREIDVEGWFINARRIGDDVYTVVSTWADVPWELWELAWDESLDLPDTDWDAGEAALAAARAEARTILKPLVAAVVDDLELGQLLPRAFDSAPDEPASGEPLMACTDVYRPEGISRPSMLSVVHLGLDGGAGTDLSATGLMSEGWTVYASQENLYIAQSSWWWWWGWGQLDDLSTHIHRFSLAGAESTYEASGKVPGWLLNQFSMSEHDGYLRVATTDHDWWWGEGPDAEGGNNVLVLEQQGEVLAPVGEVRGIAPGERIFAARFQGERGYLVTFRQVDPLFTLDLSTPTSPQVIGELKIPGYSAYLHPVGPDHLLAVGMDGEDDGTLTGLAVNLFNISDFANPQLQDQVTFDSSWGWSEALWDHRAFTFHRDVLTIPFYSWDHDPLTGDWEAFSGVLSVDVDTELGLAEVGRVDHSDLVAESQCLYGWAGGCDDYYWYASMRRSVVIEDNLLSISDYGVKVTDLNDPSAVRARVLFWPL